MLSFATYLRNCTHAVKWLWITALYTAYAVWMAELLLTTVSPLRSLSTAALWGLQKVSFCCSVPALSANWPFDSSSGVLVFHKPTRTLHLGQVGILRNRLRRWLNKYVLTNSVGSSSKIRWIRLPLRSCWVLRRIYRVIHMSQVTLNYCSVYCVCCLSGRKFYWQLQAPCEATAQLSSEAFNKWVCL